VDEGDQADRVGHRLVGKPLHPAGAEEIIQDPAPSLKEGEQVIAIVHRRRKALALYWEAPVGKRSVRCGCTDKFKRDDPKTECLEEGPYSRRGPVCQRYPWYMIAAAIGGKRRAGDGRPAAKYRQGEGEGCSDE
jgi:hypothetical protein